MEPLQAHSLHVRNSHASHTLRKTQEEQAGPSIVVAAQPKHLVSPLSPSKFPRWDQSPGHHTPAVGVPHYALGVASTHTQTPTLTKLEVREQELTLSPSWNSQHSILPGNRPHKILLYPLFFLFQSTKVGKGFQKSWDRFWHFLRKKSHKWLGISI